ncbi:enhancer of rudimentary homolog [Drosophila albomicans]|uniref:Enhancer of rudimentary homolog n=1 Tax=Drosophila albomicans TaxID=7291 RepID=A0A6P8WBP0_DROAB|nr:enhancer of rudimentary homolog [Drosophila albomicans]
MSHTILLIHPKPSSSTRTYSEYDSVKECLEAICQIYEEHLKRQSPNVPTITTSSYAPYSKEWIKDQIYILFREKAMDTDK